MSQFDDETALTATGEGQWQATPSDRWNIGVNANGGYAMAPVLRAMGDRVGRPDPMSVTTHFLRPLQPDGQPVDVTAQPIRLGRTISVVSGTLAHHGRDRLSVIAAFTDLSHPASVATATVDLRPPALPPASECIDRAALDQGVALPILERLDIRIHADGADAGSDDAVMEGWIRLADGSPASTATLPLFADAFPPSLFAKFGRVGWVPTIELTVHVRRRPAPGWIQARFECDDLIGGRMVETGTLWDSTGAVVARSRQVGLLLVDA